MHIHANVVFCGEQKKSIMEVEVAGLRKNEPLTSLMDFSSSTQSTIFVWMCAFSPSVFFTANALSNFSTFEHLYSN